MNKDWHCLLSQSRVCSLIEMIKRVDLETNIEKTQDAQINDDTLEQNPMLVDGRAEEDESHKLKTSRLT